MADAFGKHASDQWEKEYGFDNHNGLPGEAESWHMGNDNRSPRVSFKNDGSKKLNNIGHRPGLRKKLDQGGKAASVAPNYNSETGNEVFNNGYGVFSSEKDLDRIKNMF